MRASGAPASAAMAATSSACVRASGGSRPGRRAASMLLPAPGGPTIKRLWPPAAATSRARRAPGWPRTSDRHGAGGAAGQLAAMASGKRQTPAT